MAPMPFYNYPISPLKQRSSAKSNQGLPVHSQPLAPCWLDLYTFSKSSFCLCSPSRYILCSGTRSLFLSCLGHEGGPVGEGVGCDKDHRDGKLW